MTVVEMQFQENYTSATENGLILDVCQGVRGKVTWLIMTLEQLSISIEEYERKLASVMWIRETHI